MARGLESSVVVEFATSASDKGQLRWEQDNEREAEDDSQVYLRLYPHHPERLIITSGSLSKRGTDEKDAEETIIFSGDREVSLSYGEVHSVTIQKVGAYYDLDGNDIAVSLVFDSTRNVVRSNIPCYGVARIAYKAPYQSYLFTFAGKGCTEEDDGGTDTVLGFLPKTSSLFSSGGGSGFSESTIVAIDFTTDASATITLTPPDCGAGEFFVQRDDEADLPSLKLEVHKDFPPRLTAVDKDDDILRAGCKVRLIPDVAATVYISSGSLRASAESVSYEPVLDAITFNGSGSVNLKYQPFGSIGLQPVSDFWDIWGNTVSPEFAKPGDRVTEVDWINSNSYVNPRTRIVGEDEIIAVSAGNKVIPVFGVIEVSYTISFRVYDVEFILENPSFPEEGWHVAHMIAFYEEQSAFLKLDPPTLKER